ncbi:DUF523 domain-containing protein [Pantoea sp. A4]|uniref:DUF523 domain-containing protein n=1 Tax=Pantoea sp. A4 TaxID=1225184 RepID=UPI0003800A53|nr:DUF523 domain-containing protein [Pantoea sp. A4]
MRSKILVSACLMGLKVRYNGSDKKVVAEILTRWQQEGRLVVHCPELAAGLLTPRLPAEIIHGSGDKVLSGCAQVQESDGQDVTAQYVLAGWLAVAAAQAEGCRFALLSDGSPTCGSQYIYDGSFSGVKHPGAGIAATLLRQQGVEVFSEQQLEALIRRVHQYEAQGGE